MTTFSVARPSSRTFATALARIAVRQLFKVRTWLVGGTVAGGTAAANVRDIQLLVVVLFVCAEIRRMEE